jgi:NitT/TauT family transport system permease protein
MTAVLQEEAVLATRTRSARGRRGLRNRIVTAASAIVLLGLWEVVADQVNPILLAPPSAVAKALWSMILDGSMGEALAASAKPFITGYLLAVAVGIPLGLLIGRFAVVEAALGWLVVAGYALPMIALTPIFILWFGLGFLVKAAMVMTMTVINTWNGVQNVPRSLIEVGAAFCAGQPRILRAIVLPSVIPSIMTGLRIGVGKAVIGIVIAEFFTALGGIGGVIVTSGQGLQPDRMFAAVIVLLVLAMLLTALVGVIERRIAPWNRAITGSGE